MTMFRRLLPFALSLLTLPAVATAAPEHREAQRPDGSTVNWTLDLPEGGEKVGLLVIAQGSGCAAAMESRSMQQARAAFGNFAALTVEKYGVRPGAALPCVLRVITSGTCTPLLFEFPGIDLADYFETGK